MAIFCSCCISCGVIKVTDTKIILQICHSKVKFQFLFASLQTPTPIQEIEQKLGKLENFDEWGMKEADMARKVVEIG